MSPPTPTRSGSTDAREQLRQDGFVVLRAAFDPEPLVEEVAAAFAAGFADRRVDGVSDEAGIAFRYLPMMCERTPRSLELLHHLVGLADRLVGAETMPLRAKAVEYHGSSRWHRDSDLDLLSVGFACYLEPVAAATGALRVVPGSHRSRTGDDGTSSAPVAVETVPGDVIVFDEHLLHASHGGAVRRQWRVDVVARPEAGTIAAVREHVAATFSPDGDVGYDVEAFPTYGPHWRRTCRPADDAALEAVGAYAAAAVEEAAARRRTTTITPPKETP